jgi:C-terminal processing protease CtpA/Prc
MFANAVKATVAAFLAAGVLVLAAAPWRARADEKPQAKDLNQRIKEAEEELQRLRQARLKELEEETKKVEANATKAREDLIKAIKDNDKDAIAKAQEATRKVGEERTRLFQERSQLESKIRLNTPTPPPLKTEEQRFGFHTSTPSVTLADQLNLDAKQGRVVDRIDPDSPAAKAGMKANDVLLEIEGKQVPRGLLEYRRFLGDLKTDTPMEAVVLRQNKKETLKGLTLPK